MPFQVGSVAVHDDGQHTGSAKRDTANGVAGLFSDGSVLANGPTVQLKRDGSNQVYLQERTSAESWLQARRNGVNDYSAWIQETAGMSQIQTASQKNIANGIAGLDASVLLALAQQRLNFKVGAFSRDTSLASGNQSVAGVGFVPRLLVFIANTPATPEVSIGYDDGTNHESIFGIHAVTAGQWQNAAGTSIWLQQAAGILYTGIISSLDADGFTITWTKTGAKVGTASMYYVAVR